MSVELKMVPSLRFKEFNKSWSQNRLGEISTFRRGSFPQPYGLPKWYDDEDGTPFVQVYDVGSNFKLKPTTKQKISELAKPKSVFVKEGSVVLTIQGSIGRIAITQYDSYVDRTLLIFKSFRVEMNTEFFVNIVYLLFDIEKRKAPGGTIKTITKDKLKDFNVIFPSLPEQQKIAAFLSAVDQKIQQLTRKKELLETYKKGLMQQLFSGALRFKDEEGKEYPDWEEKRLGEVAIVNPRSTKLPDSFTYIDLESVSKGQLVKEEIISLDEAPSRAQRSLVEQDILYQTVRPYQMNNLFFNKPGDYVASTGYAQLRTNEAPMYIYHLLHTHFFVNKVIVRCTGTSYPAINSSELAKIRVPVPSKPEQYKIAKALAAIDSKIQSISTQITKTQTFKKGLLQQMFV